MECERELSENSSGRVSPLGDTGDFDLEEVSVVVVVDGAPVCGSVGHVGFGVEGLVIVVLDGADWVGFDHGDHNGGQLARRSRARLPLDTVLPGGHVGTAADGDAADWCSDVFDVGRVVEAGVVHAYDVVGPAGFGSSPRLAVRL